MKKLFLSFAALILVIALSAQSTLSRLDGEVMTKDRTEIAKSKTVLNIDQLKKIERIEKHSSAKSVGAHTASEKQAMALELKQDMQKVVSQHKTVNAVIWSDDFSVPTNWQIVNLAGNTQNWVITTAGPTGTYSSQMGPINSTTASNGFGLYDSDAIGTSANAAGDQNSLLRYASVIDLTGHSYVKIRFQQSYRKYNCQTFVGVRVGTNPWVNIEVNDNVAINDFGDDLVEVDISSIAGNSANVKIRFQYVGEWDYAWMVDDVSIEDAFVNDAETRTVYTLGKLPLGVGHTVEAPIKNVGASAITSLTATLNVTGANTYTDVVSVSSLASGAIENIVFAPYSLSVAGNNTVTVSVSADNNPANDSYSYNQISGNTFSYADTSAVTGALGYADGSGLMLCRYWAGTSKSVVQVNAFIAADADNLGQTVYGVVTNDQGTIVAQSANHVVAPADTGQWVSLALIVPPTFTNEEFYAGLAQTANVATPYYPLGTQTEAYARPDAFYITDLTGGTLTEANTYGRFMIEAELGSGNNYDCAVSAILSPNNSSSCILGSNELVEVTVANLGVMDVSNVPVSYMVNGSNLVNEVITGLIPAGTSVNYIFSTAVNLSSLQTYQIEAFTALANDEDVSNDTTSVLVTHGDAFITVDILTDDYGYETYWGLFNTAGDLVYIDGIYDNATLYSINVCAVSTECYTFAIFDDYGDGIAAPGYYEVSYNGVLVGGSTSFAGSEEYLFNIGGGCPADELGVDMVYTLGKMPINQGAPHVVSALVYNYGTDPQYGVPITLNITGANTFTSTQTIASVLPGEEVEVFFSAFTPSSIGINNVAVAIPSDDNNLNNSFSYYQDVNTSAFSYADTSAISSGIGYDTGEGLLFNKHFMNGAGTVKQVGVLISNDADAVGNIIAAVVLDSDTNIVAQSADYTILSTDLSTWVYLDLAVPVAFMNEEFYAGLEQTANTTTGYFPLGVQDETFARADTYYGAAADGSQSVAYTSLGRFGIEAVLMQAPQWSYNNTGSNHTIMISNLIDLTIDGSPIEVGDYIGVFYNNNGTEECGGYVVYDGNALGLSAWGAQSGMFDGFQDGEVFNWRIWDATDGAEYSAVAVYNTLDFPNNQYYTTNGMSGLASLTASSSMVQSINLTAGWGIYSSYIDLFEPSLDSIFGAIASDIVIIKNGLGMVYWPQWSLNAIGDWTVEQGYQINSAIQQSVDFEGMIITPEAYTFVIPSGWSIMAYLRTSPGNAEVMLSSIVNDIVIVKNGLGSVYWPQWNLNAIGDLLPGQGYQINVLSTQTYTYPANTGTISKSFIEARTPVIKSTGSNMIYGFPSSLKGINEGDVLRAYDTHGNLVGEAIVAKGITALTVWGDDEVTFGIDGLIAMEMPVFRLQRNAVRHELELGVDAWLEGDGLYKANGIAVAQSLVVDEFISLEQNQPNPATALTQIEFSLPEPMKVDIRLYNVLGECVKVLAAGNYSSGVHSIELDVSEIPAGSYFYRMNSGNFANTKMLEVK